MTFGSSPGIVRGVTEDSERPLGEWLRQRREELGISLEDAQEATRIRIRYLEALEAEDLEALPNPVVASGFLRNYAAYLELDPQEAVDRCPEITGPSEQEFPTVNESSPFSAESFRPVPLHDIPDRRSRRWLAAILVIILVVALAILAWQGYPYISNWLSIVQNAARPAPTERATSATLSTATFTPTVTTTATSAPTANAPRTAAPTQSLPTLELTLTPTFTPSPSPTPTQPVYTGIFLELVFTETSWIQVAVDGVRQFQGELEAGTYRSWYGEERIELRVGNAGAVEATVNGQKLGPLGAPGEVIDRIFEIVDNEVAEATPTRAPEITGTVTVAPAAPPATLEITPTGSVTPTGSLTPTVSVTPTLPITPTATFTPTATITPTAGP